MTLDNLRGRVLNWHFKLQIREKKDFSQIRGQTGFGILLNIYVQQLDTGFGPTWSLIQCLT